jgi:hypothetical protein
MAAKEKLSLRRSVIKIVGKICELDYLAAEQTSNPTDLVLFRLQIYEYLGDTSV